MATIKAFSDLEQSKKLAEILPPESADMFLAMNGTLPVMSKYIDNGLVTADETAIPCWSLAALLNVLPRMSLEREKFFYNRYLYNSDYSYRVIVNKYTDNNIFGHLENNPVDACVSMIIKLHELNLL